MSRLLHACRIAQDCITDVFCFFFKQKTAYELRISDWSSDVCSSDLFARQLARHAQKFTPPQGREQIPAIADLAAVPLGQPLCDQPLLPARQRISHVSAKIGSASCRERVCQSG